MDGWGKIPEGAKYAGMGSRVFRKWLKSGLKHSRLPSGTVLIRFADIDSFLESYQVEDQGKPNDVDAIVDAAVKDLQK